MFQFNWQKRNVDFVKWMFVNLAGDFTKDRDKFERMSDATNNFTDVRLTVQVNGIEVDAEQFFKYCEKFLISNANDAAREMLEESIPDLEELQDAVYQAQRALADSLKKSLQSAGVTWPEEY